MYIPWRDLPSIQPAENFLLFSIKRRKDSFITGAVEVFWMPDSDGDIFHAIVWEFLHIILCSIYRLCTAFRFFLGRYLFWSVGILRRILTVCSGLKFHSFYISARGGKRADSEWINFGLLEIVHCIFGLKFLWIAFVWAFDTWDIENLNE